MEATRAARQTLSAVRIRASALSSSCRPVRSLRCKDREFINAKVQIRGAKTYKKPPGRIEQMVIDARTNYPILFPMMLIATIGSVSMFTVMAYDQYKRESSAASPFPPPVEERLRLALHYTHISPDPETAIGYFLDAIKKGEELNMDPFSKEFVGMRIRFSEMLEQFGHVKAALEVLNEITRDFEQKLVDIDQIVANPEKTSTEESLQRIQTRGNTVKFIVQTKVKAAELYQSDYMQDPTMAKKILSDAVGLIVKETQDPQTNSFTEDNGAGLTTAEIAAILSQMGDLYATTGEEANAVQVYMLALQPLRTSCNGARSCREVQILSNIAATMGVALKKPNAKVNGKPVTKQSAAAARSAILKWADQAIATAETVQPGDRDQICDTAVLSAELTTADLLFESGDKAKSTEAYVRLLSKVRDKNLPELVDLVEKRMKASG